MMYIHDCRNCKRIHMLNGHKITCPKCKRSLSELKMPYTDYVNMNAAERTALLSSCSDEKTLQSLCTSYRMYKYSKWYKSFLEASQVGIPYPTSSFVSCDFLSTHPLQPKPAYQNTDIFYPMIVFSVDFFLITQ